MSRETIEGGFYDEEELASTMCRRKLLQCGENGKYNFSTLNNPNIHFFKSKP
jgi:hypothetical protein